VQIAFSSAPESVTVSTGGGAAALIVPGGPYALSVNSGGAPQIIAIATSVTADRSLTIRTGGGRLLIRSQDSPGTFLLPLRDRTEVRWPSPLGQVFASDGNAHVLPAPAFGIPVTVPASRLGQAAHEIPAR
jgi:hypothetical protein